MNTKDTFEIHDHADWGFSMRRRRGDRLFPPARPVAVVLNGGEVICFANAQSCADYMSCAEPTVHAGLKTGHKVKGYVVRHATAEEAKRFFAPLDVRTADHAAYVTLKTPKKTIAQIRQICADILEVADVIDALRKNPTTFKNSMASDMEKKLQAKVQELR